jgi:hypothetical protein
LIEEFQMLQYPLIHAGLPPAKKIDQTRGGNTGNPSIFLLHSRGNPPTAVDL